MEQYIELAEAKLRDSRDQTAVNTIEQYPYKTIALALQSIAASLIVIAMKDK